MTLTNNAIEGFLVHELVAVRRAEQRLAQQLEQSNEDVDRIAIIRAISFLGQRLDSIESVLTQLDDAPATQLEQSYVEHPSMPLYAA